MIHSAGLVRFLSSLRVPVPILNQVQVHVLKLKVTKDRLKLSTQTQASPLDKGPVVKSLPVFSVKFTNYNSLLTSGMHAVHTLVHRL